MLRLSEETIQKLKEAKQALENDLKTAQAFYDINYSDWYTLSLTDGAVGFSYSQWLDDIRNTLSELNSLTPQSSIREKNCPIQETPEENKEIKLGYVWYQRQSISIGMEKPKTRLVKCEVIEKKKNTNIFHVFPILKFTIDFPLTIPKSIELVHEDGSGWTGEQFINAVETEYKKIYEEEEENPGKYGIYDHSLEDLSVSLVTKNKDGSFKLHVYPKISWLK